MTTHIVQADFGQVARALQVLVSEMTVRQNDECVSGSSSCVCEEPPPPRDVQVMNDPISDPGQKRPSLAGADPLCYFSSPHSAISIADLSHTGAESLLGVSIFNYLTPPISAALSPL